MKQVQKGFTLIELMIVIAIVGILAAVALPAYQDYTVRAKVSEGLAKSAEAKTTIAEFFVARVKFPLDANEAGIDVNVGTDLVKSIKMGTWNAANGGLLTIVMNEGNLGGDSSSSFNSFQLSVVDTINGTVIWRCKAGNSQPLPPKYLPASCR